MMELSSFFPTFCSPDLLLFIAPLWFAVVVGVLVGWVWRPSWARDDKIFTFFNNNLPLPAATTTTTVNSFESRQVYKEKSGFVTGDDFRHLWNLVEVKDGGPSWIQMMDRSTPTFSYQAWRRDPHDGPPQYRSRTVFEDATPEMVRDFFWDDDFRSNWDDMLLFSSTLEACKDTGTMVVQWVRKVTHNSLLVYTKLFFFFFVALLTVVSFVAVPVLL